MNATTSRRIAAFAVLLAVPTLSSCGVNFSAQTDQVYTPAEGVNDRSGDVDVLNALVVADTDGAGRFIAGLANNTDKEETLTGITGVDVDQSLQISLDGGDFKIPAYGFLQLADKNSGVVSVDGDMVKKGYFVTVRLSFSDAAPVTMQIPVVEPDQDFASITVPSASASSSPSESATSSPSESASPSSGG